MTKEPHPWLILLMSATVTVQAETLTVTTANIAGPGSLAAVIAQANATPGSNVIQFGVTNAITLGLPLPAITKSLAIIGRADTATVISGGGTLPLLEFAARTTNRLSRLVLANGIKTTGGGAAIVNSGNLYMDSCVVTNHRSINGSGGAIINSGTMAITSSLVSDSQATNGGAIYNEGMLSVTGTQFSSNKAENGGAIYNTGSVVLLEVGVSSNRSTLGFGGGLYSSGTASITASTFNGNSANGGAGGNGYDVGGGGGAGLGGAIFIMSGDASAINSTVAGNAAAGGAGGSAMLSPESTNLTSTGGGNNPGNYLEIGPPDGGFGGGGGGGQRGYAPFNGGYGGFGGGGGGVGPLFGKNGGFGGGTANGVATYGMGGGGGAGIGAGIFVRGGTMRLVNCTVAFNQATGGPGGQTAPLGLAGDGGQGIGGGIFNLGGTVALANTIVAANIAQNSSPDVWGSFDPEGINLIGNNQGATNLSVLDFQNVSANLGPLQDNGGPTLTCAPLRDSVAIAAGTGTSTPDTDQRGVPRPKGSSVDIGAVQIISTSPVIIGASFLENYGFTLDTVFDATNSYAILGSTTLTDWGSLTNYINGGSHRFTDPTATNGVRGFYRTRVR